jgi:hypothetical protein
VHDPNNTPTEDPTPEDPDRRPPPILPPPRLETEEPTGLDIESHEIKE